MTGRNGAKVGVVTAGEGKEGGTKGVSRARNAP